MTVFGRLSPTRKPNENPAKKSTTTAATTATVPPKRFKNLMSTNTLHVTGISLAGQPAILNKVAYSFRMGA